MTRDAKTTSTPPAAAEEPASNALHQDERTGTATSMSASRHDTSKEYGVARGDDGGSGSMSRDAAVLVLSLEDERDAAVDASSALSKKSLLTPLIADNLVLSTPVLPLVSRDDQLSGKAAVRNGDNSGEENVVQADAEPGAVGQTNPQRKRNRRALFAAGNENADQVSNGQDVLEVARSNYKSADQPDQCDQTSQEQRQGNHLSGSSSEADPGTIVSLPEQQQENDDDNAKGQLLDNEVTALSNTLDRKRASPHEIYDRRPPQPGSSATTKNAFDNEPDDELTLLIQKKWKRSVRQTQAGVLLPFSTLADAHQQSREDDAFFSLSQPSRPSFTRSMSSHSVFISKPLPSTPNSISSKWSAIGSSSASSGQLIDGGIHQLVLPTIRSASHPDLNVISPQTVSRLLNGDFKAQLASYALIDCRFTYEHEGGSLKGAQSLCDPASVEQKFLWNPSKDCEHTALVFYCEFSANRAPKMLRHVRNLDRWIHAEKYPELFYPELYLVDGGYKNCFETIKEEICEPQSYTPMNHQDFVESCKREFALWRKRWKAHKTSACASRFQLHHHQRQGTSSNSLRKGGSGGNDGRPGGGDQHENQGETGEQQAEEDFELGLPALHPPVTLRSFSEML